MTSSYLPDPPSPSSSSSSVTGNSSNSKRPVTRTPSNLRFQRRTSERAFYEGALRDGTPTMDYAAGGSSPWANTPEATRTSFGDEAGVPRRDLPGPAIPEEEAHGANGGEERQRRGDYAHQTQPPGSWSPEQQQQQQPHHPQQQQWQYQQQHQQHQQQPQPQHHHQGQDRGSGEENRRPHSARYRNAPPHHQQQQRQQQHQPQYKLQAKITGLERGGKKDPILRFDVYVCIVHNLMSTNLPKFRTTQFRDIRRTHSEFEKLHAHLVASNPEALVPAVPPPFTSAGMGTDEDEARTKTALQRWLNVITSNEILQRDEEMVFFVESDFGYSPVVRKYQPATGVRRKMLKQFAPPPDDTPELLEARPIVKAFYLGAMDTQQKIDRLVRHRRSLGVAESDLGTKIAALVPQENHPGLANAYRKLGKVVQSTGDFHAAQGTAEATTLSDPFAYHSSDALVVKETLTNRHILLRELIQAQQSTRTKLNAADRLKASSSVKREKVDEAISALDEARSHESYLQQKTQRVTANLLVEKRKWFARTAGDLRAGIREYVVRQIEAERRTLATLEAVRPDVRSIDASGGLSRLGREGMVAARKASLVSSQGRNGDAWSGFARRAEVGGVNRLSGGSAPGGLEGVGEENEEGEEGGAGEAADGGKGKGRKRAQSGASSLKGVKEEENDGRVDARNAAVRLAQTTF
ncbi:Vacuolar protein sorting-associated protein 17 [Friedmanniomyces endolithicus]|nr:Vacuolar protein sorting-associated protein 17 [Friedmanniomyces endolithicus]